VAARFADGCDHGGMTWRRSPAIGVLITAFVKFAVVVLFVVLIATGVAGAGALGLGITAVVLGLVGTVLLFAGRRMLHRYREAQRLRVDGVAGQAQVLELSQTG
jgi:nitrate reductase gamma subunit